MRNSTYRAWIDAGQPPDDQRPGKDDVLATDNGGYQVRRYESYTATAEVEGDIEALDLWVGQGVGLVSQVKSAGDIVREIADEAQKTIQNLAIKLGH